MADRNNRNRQNDRRRVPYERRPPGGSLVRRVEDLIERVDALEDRILEAQSLWLALLASTINGEAGYETVFQKLKLYFSFKSSYFLKLFQFQAMVRNHPMLSATMETIRARWRVMTSEIVRLRHEEPGQVAQTDINAILAAIAQAAGRGNAAAPANAPAQGQAAVPANVRNADQGALNALFEQQQQMNPN